MDDWVAADAVVLATLADLLPETLDEPSLARRVFAALPSEATLVVASSMPVRDPQLFAAPRTSPPRVLANRGANGIDGVVSTAVGVAIGSGSPTVALVGDLAFLHDVSALVGDQPPSVSLTVVVADNGGGGIFSFLEQAALVDEPTFESLFGTPQAQDPAAVAAGFGWPVDRVRPGLRGPVRSEPRRPDRGRFGFGDPRPRTGCGTTSIGIGRCSPRCPPRWRG